MDLKVNKLPMLNYKKKGGNLISDIRKHKSRKWLITINNPQDKNISFEKIKEIIKSKYQNIIYFCYCQEIGRETHTVHIHIFLYSKSPLSGNSLIKTFQGCHLDPANGTCEQNRAYIYKIGKWENTEKEDTRIEGMQFESGECPVEKPGRRSDLEELKNLLLEGKTNGEIYNINASYMRYASTLDRVRQDLIYTKYKNEPRFVEVEYVHGKTGTGKTRTIMEKYGYANVYRVTDYTHPFDGYEGQDVIIFEEFRSSLKIQDMLNYLDIYPVVLPCRYNNKQACFHKIYICTNWTLDQQYESVQQEYKETWNAFLRRIHTIRDYEDDGIYYYKQGIDEYGEINYFTEDGQKYLEYKKGENRK